MTMCNLYHDIESTSLFFFERSIVIDRSRLWRNRNNTRCYNCPWAPLLLLGGRWPPSKNFPPSHDSLWSNGLDMHSGQTDWYKQQYLLCIFHFCLTALYDFPGLLVWEFYYFFTGQILSSKMSKHWRNTYVCMFTARCKYCCVLLDFLVGS